MTNHFASAVQFGRELIRTRDLDPVYVVFTAVPRQQRARVLFAYTCLYHLGAAAAVASAPDKGQDTFASRLQAAAVNEGLLWPRGSERRHWRGQNALNTVNHFINNFSGRPEDVVEYW